MDKYSTEKLYYETGNPNKLGRALRSLSRNGPSKFKLQGVEICRILHLVLTHQNTLYIPDKYIQAAFERSASLYNLELFQKLSNTFALKTVSPKTLGQALSNLSNTTPSQLKLYAIEYYQLLDLIFTHQKASKIPRKYILSSFENSAKQYNLDLYQKLTLSPFSKVVTPKTLGRILRNLSRSNLEQLKLHHNLVFPLSKLILTHDKAQKIPNKYIQESLENCAIYYNTELCQRLNTFPFKNKISSLSLGKALRNLSRNGPSRLKLYGTQISKLVDLILAHDKAKNIPRKYITQTFEKTATHEHIKLFQKLSATPLCKKVSDKEISLALKLSWHLLDSSQEVSNKFQTYSARHPNSLFNLLYESLWKKKFSTFEQNIVFFQSTILKRKHVAALIFLCDKFNLSKQKKIIQKYYEIKPVAKKHFFSLIVRSVYDLPPLRIGNYQKEMAFYLYYLALKGSPLHFEQLVSFDFLSSFRQEEIFQASQIAEIAGNHDIVDLLAPFVTSTPSRKQNNALLKKVISKTVKKIDHIKLKKLPLKFISKCFYKAGFRVICFENFKGIGHLATEPACALQEKKVGLLPYKLILLFTNPASINNANNTTLLKLWRKYFFSYVFEAPENIWQKLLTKSFYWIFGKTAEHFSAFHYPTEHYLITGVYYPFSSARIFEMNNITPPPTLRLPKKTLSHGKKVLQQLGLPKNAWFVSFHARDSQFLKNVDPEYENNYTHRNVNVDDYHLALEEVIKRGGWCIRIGSKKTLPLSQKLISLGKVIDYPHTPYVSDEMDIFLLSQCRFCLCCNSGPATVPGIFNKPIVKVQVSPIWSLAYRDHDLLIPKLNYLKKEKRLATFNEMTGAYVSESHDTSFAKNQIDVIDNTPEEIRDVTLEMLDRLDGKASYSVQDAEQQKLFSQCKHKAMYTFKSPARVGKAFLNKYSYLLTQDN